MNTEKSPTPSTTIPAWVRELFLSIDRRDATAFAGFVAPQGQFRYGSNPAVQGRENVEKFVAGFFASMNGLSHTLENVWEQPGVVFIEGRVRYHLLDDRHVEVPFCNLFRMEGHLVKDYLVFTDPTPLLPPRA